MSKLERKFALLIFLLRFLNSVTGLHRHFFHIGIHVGGKSFSAYINLAMNWPEANSYCDSQNMRLARIETYKEAEFLWEALKGYGTSYWTSGRELREYTSFLWDTSNTIPWRSGFHSWENINPHVPYHYCVAFLSEPFNRPSIYATDCRSKFSGFICQSNDANKKTIGKYLAPITPPNDNFEDKDKDDYCRKVKNLDEGGRDNVSTIHHKLLHVPLGKADEHSKRKLGSVNGKIFKAFAHYPKNWEEAQLLCKSFRMNLAAILTAQEANLLYRNLKIEREIDFFWTSAREYGAVTSFIWDDGTSIFDGFNTWTNVNTLGPYYYCAYFKSGENGPEMIADLCKSKLTGTLCEENII